MNFKKHNPQAVSPAVGNYAHAIEIEPGFRYLFISGQIPEKPDGTVPLSFEDQCNAVWDNIFDIMKSANMGPENLVKVTTFLTHADQAEANGQIRRQRLGELTPALTVVIVQTLDSKWLLEIEAVAAAKA